jgi:hypothetical protein
MDEDRVLARLGRIDALDRSGAGPGELLVELRSLIREAEELARGRTADDGPAMNDDRTEEVVGRLRAALARDIIGG